MGRGAAVSSRAKMLARNCHERGPSFAAGYVYEVGPRITSEECVEFDVCT